MISVLRCFWEPIGRPNFERNTDVISAVDSTYSIPSIIIVGFKTGAGVKKPVITSGITPTFPYGMLIGTIDQIAPDKSTNNFIIKIKTAANFYNLQYVYSIKNFQKEEINKLLEKAKGKINN